jgi:putative Mg2+ transporter-C (MgtC) family protein
MTLAEFSLRLVAALVLGTLVGLERQYRQRMAGLRTNALVATGTALFVMITPLLGPMPNMNPSQIPAYIVSGIGFLAGGVIFKERLSVSGLNTAATLWCTAAVGALVGIGHIPEAAIGSLAVLFANIALRPVAQRVNQAEAAHTEIIASFEVVATVRPACADAARAALIAAARESAVMLHAVYSDDREDGLVDVTADITVTGTADAALEAIVTRVGGTDGVSAASWRAVPTEPGEREMVPET